MLKLAETDIKQTHTLSKLSFILFLAALQLYIFNTPLKTPQQKVHMLVLCVDTNKSRELTAVVSLAACRRASSWFRAASRVPARCGPELCLVPPSRPAVHQLLTGGTV